MNIAVDCGNAAETTLTLQPEYIDALLVSLSKNPYLDTVFVSKIRWDTLQPDENGPMQLNRGLLMLLESRRTWRAWLINIDHIHVDDEFWKRYAACIQNNPELLTAAICGIPLTLTVAQQYNRLFASQTYSDDRIQTIFLGSSDPLPMQLINAFQAKLKAHQEYLSVLARAEKRRQIRPSQHDAQAATREEREDGGVNVTLLHDSKTWVLEHSAVSNDDEEAE